MNSITIIRATCRRPQTRDGMLVGFVGPAGAGKTTATNGMWGGWTSTYPERWTRHRFAEPLKAMLGHLGLTDRHTDGDLKEAPCDLLGGKTPRWAMQTLGTEWGRNLIYPELWFDAWRRTLPGGNVVVDDCRFPNEADAIRALGGVIVRIARPGYGAGGHPSEAQEVEEDALVTNVGTVLELARAASAAVHRLYQLPEMT